MEFVNPEDRAFFKKMLGAEKEEDFSSFHELFYFRPVSVKNKEFNKQRNTIVAELEQRFGHTCMLKYDCCDLHSGTQVDHLIPLSSNILNKELRQLKAAAGRKVATQSIGSNHLNNLVLACSNCNQHKKHRFLEPERLRVILALKFRKRY